LPRSMDHYKVTKRSDGSLDHEQSATRKQYSNYREDKTIRDKTDEKMRQRKNSGGGGGAGGGRQGNDEEQGVWAYSIGQEMHARCCPL